MTDEKDSSAMGTPLSLFWTAMQESAQLCDQFFSLRGFRLTPDKLDQSILPDWFSTTINVNNSGAPDAERSAVAKYSYGRQLGWIVDALAVLISERGANASRFKELDQLITLHDDIEKIKKEAEEKRLGRLEADLALLKEKRPDAYKRLLVDLRKDL